MNTATLIDPFQRRIAYLRLSVTDFCNFRCHYCLPQGYQGKRLTNELSLSEIAILVQAFAESGTKKVRLSGGEPTMRRDIVELVAAVKAQAGIEKVALTTNGHRLEYLYKDLLAAGIDQINLSVDSFKPDVFQKITGKNRLPQILIAVDALLAEGFSNIKLNGLLMRDHALANLDDALAFVKQRPLTMRFIEVMQTGDNHAFFKQEHLSAGVIVERLLQAGWRQRQRSPLAGPAQEFIHPDYQGGIGIIAPYSKDFCNSCNRLRVTAMGKMHLCLFASVAYDLRAYLDAGDVEGLKAQLQRLLAFKPQAHQLHNNDSGIMPHLAHIGG